MTMSSLHLLQCLEPALVYGLCPLLQKPLGEHFPLADSGNLRQLGVTEVAVSHRWHNARDMKGRSWLLWSAFKTPFLSSLQGLPDAVPTV